MIRLAKEADISQIAAIYDAIHTEEEQGRITTGWERNIYPTRQTAIEAMNKKELFVMELDGKIVAAAKINQEQVPEYEHAAWKYPVTPEEVMVIHTLVVDPKEKGKGYATSFIHYYETYAIEQNCPYLRMDTNEKNIIARRLYSHLGYVEIGIVPCIFNGIQGVNLVCLEKKLEN